MIFLHDWICVFSSLQEHSNSAGNSTVRRQVISLSHTSSDCFFSTAKLFCDILVEVQVINNRIAFTWLRYKQQSCQLMLNWYYNINKQGKLKKWVVDFYKKTNQFESSTVPSSGIQCLRKTSKIWKKVHWKFTKCLPGLRHLTYCLIVLHAVDFSYVFYYVFILTC